MAPSPRKHASVPFDQSWHETNSSAFDPASLTLSKVPRAWERKAETKRTRDGKEKKVWRRYTLRSQAGDAVADDDEPRELDARNRVVKKLRVGAEGLQSKTVKPKTNKRALVKGTRYDRRKSVLPRKKSAPVFPLVDEDSVDIGANLPLVEAEDENDTGSEADADYGLQEMVAHGSHQNGEVVDPGFSFTVGETAIPTVDSGTLGDECLENIAESTGLLESHPGQDVSEEPVNTTQQDSAEALHLTSLGSLDNCSAQLQGPADSSSNPAPTKDEHPVPNVHDDLVIENLEPTGDVIVEESMELPGDSPADQSPEPVAEQQNLGGNMKAPAKNHTLDAEMMTVNLDLLTDMMQAEVSRENETPPDAKMRTVNHDLLTDTMRAAAVRDTETPSSPEIEMAEVQIEDCSDSPTKLPTQHLDCDISEDAMEPQGLKLNTAEEPQLDDMEHSEVDAEEALENEPTITEASPQSELLQEIHATQSDAVVEASDAPTPECGMGCGISPAKENHSVLHSMEPDTCPSEASGPLVNDITDGLTLGPTLTPFAQPARPSPQSSSPPPAESRTHDAYTDDATMTVALDEDTALLKDFLTRAAANKANKAANISRRTSLQNRRDSDAIRNALASPRKVLEDKDPNSPSKFDNDATLDLSQTLTLNVELEPPSSPSGYQQGTDDAEDAKPAGNSRRSTRMRTTRLPHPATTLQLQTPKISVRRTDGNEHIVLKKTEAQETSRLTSANTRKNKQGAFPVTLKLLKLASEAAMASGTNEASAAPARDPNKKNVRWDAKLAYFQDETTTLASVMEAVAEAESLATPDELSASLSEPSAKRKSKEGKERSSTPRARKVRNLGASNGTPGKGLLAPSSLLPTDVQEEKEKKDKGEKEAAQKQKIPRASSKAKKLPVSSGPADAPLPASSAPPPLPTSLGNEAVANSRDPQSQSQPKEMKTTKERKSRLATPKRVKLPQPTVAVAAAAPSDGKENRPARGIAAATPKKGLPMPQVSLPVMTPAVVVVESGLPRRRAGRKV